jgi:hypothetical protein
LWKIYNKFDLNLNFEKLLLKEFEKKEKNPASLIFSARRPGGPSNLSPAAARGHLFISLFFVLLTTRPHWSVAPPSPSFLLLPLICLARPGAAMISTAPGRLPFLSSPLESANQGSIYSLKDRLGDQREGE